MTFGEKVVLITGGGRGIGEAIARAFASEGASVVLVSRTEAEIQRLAAQLASLGARTLAIVGDVSIAEDVRRVVGRTLAELGKIDVLVNCAGTYGPIGPLVENRLDAWKATIETNLLGTVFCLHAVLPHMMQRHSGVVINLSGGGAVSPFPRFSAYSTSKAAVVRLTETIAEEVREFGIRVNAIAPGAVNTRMLAQVLDAGEQAVGKEFYAGALRQKAEGGTPPTEAARLALFLASDEAAGITGRLISAVWDDWKSLSGRVSELDGSALFTLRRIDGRQFTETR